MVANAVVSADAAAGLLDKLDAVVDDLAKDKAAPAERKLAAFIKEVDSLLKDGHIGADDAQRLLDAANALAAAI
jgi:hypothetical protein